MHYVCLDAKCIALLTVAVRVLAPLCTEILHSVNLIAMAVQDT